MVIIDRSGVVRKLTWNTAGLEESVEFVLARQ